MARYHRIVRAPHAPGRMAIGALAIGLWHLVPPCQGQVPGTPLQVIITAPQLGPDSMLTTSDTSLCIQGRVVGGGGPTLLLIDNRPVPFDTVGRFSTRVDLPVGEKVIFIGVADRAGGFTRARFSMVRADPRRAPNASGNVPWIADQGDVLTWNSRLPKIYALIVGISNYVNDPSIDLKFAAKDAEEYKRFLTSTHGGRLAEENVRFLTDKEATRNNILGQMLELLRDAEEEDVFLLYFSGHGTIVDAGKDLCLVTSDAHTNSEEALRATGLLQSDVLRYVEHARPRKKVLIIDACHSGMMASIGRKGIPENSNTVLQQMAMADPTLTILTSSSDNEESYEDESLEGGHGIYSYYLIKGLQGDADASGDSIVTVHELHRYVSFNTAERALTVFKTSQRPDRLCEACNDFPLSVVGNYNIDDPRHMRSVSTNVAIDDRTTLEDVTYSNALGDKITFFNYGGSGGRTSVAGRIQGELIQGRGRIERNSIIFNDKDSRNRTRKCRIELDPDWGKLNISLWTNSGTFHDRELGRDGPGSTQFIPEGRYSGPQGEDYLTIHGRATSDKFPVTGVLDGMVFQATLSSTRSTGFMEVRQYGDQYEQERIGRFMINEDGSALVGYVIHADGSTSDLVLHRTPDQRPFDPEGRVYRDPLSTDSIGFYELQRPSSKWDHFDHINFSGSVGNEFIQCSSNITEDVLSFRNKTDSRRFIPGQLILKDGGRTLYGKVEFNSRRLLPFGKKRLLPFGRKKIALIRMQLVE
ncbi:MAG: caspase family protein [Flavobacteriales bacterium]|nr:caspase family protein [Flavobacteriales bacterium]